MARPQRANPRPSSSIPDLPTQARIAIRKTRRYIRQSLLNLAEVLEPVLKPLFAINQASAAIRSLIFVAALLLWVGFAYLKNNPAIDSIVIDGGASADPLSQMLFLTRYMIALGFVLAEPLFVPEVFREVLVISFAFWLASRIAAIYLADIFNLPNVGVAVSFIRQAAFMTLDSRRMNRLVIKEGEVAPGSQNSPIYQIGGPGFVIVNLENVAIFEKVDGTPHIVAPTGYPVLIEGFERLRRIIDLRDQFIENDEVAGRTKDGIPVSAKGIRYNFSVQRDRTVRVQKEIWEEQRLRQPFTYTDESILNLVYKKPNLGFDLIGREEVRSEIRSFIARNMLSQFLADSRDESKTPRNLPSDPTMPLSSTDQVFKAREIINQELISSFRNSGKSTIDLHWISVGTWLPPAVIPEKHQDALRRRAKSESESNPAALTRLLRITRLKELLRLIQDVPINAFGHIASQEEDPEVIKRELMLAYREKLKYALEIYRKNQLEPPIHLVAALKHLQRL